MYFLATNQAAVFEKLVLRWFQFFFKLLVDLFCGFFRFPRDSEPERLIKMALPFVIWGALFGLFLLQSAS